MKIRFTAEMKKCITIAKVAAVKAVIRECRKYDLMDYAQIAAYSVVGEPCEILKADAEVIQNNFVYNFYNDESEDIDVQLTVYAFNRQHEFYIIRGVISDIATMPTKRLPAWMTVEKYHRIDLTY